MDPMGNTMITIGQQLRIYLVQVPRHIDFLFDTIQLLKRTISNGKDTKYFDWISWRIYRLQMSLIQLQAIL